MPSEQNSQSHPPTVAPVVKLTTSLTSIKPCQNLLDTSLDRRPPRQQADPKRVRESQFARRIKSRSTSPHPVDRYISSCHVRLMMLLPRCLGSVDRVPTPRGTACASLSHSHGLASLPVFLRRRHLPATTLFEECMSELEGVLVAQGIAGMNVIGFVMRYASRVV